MKFNFKLSFAFLFCFVFGVGSAWGGNSDSQEITKRQLNFSENYSAKESKKNEASIVNGYSTTLQKSDIKIVNGECDAVDVNKIKTYYHQRDLKLNLFELSYLDIDIFELFKIKGNQCSVIYNVNKDSDAKRNCPTGFLLNPGNEQYYKDNNTQRGSRDKNAMGYYFCITAPGFNKKVLCDRADKNIGEQTGGKVKAEFEFKTKTDGDCVCSVDGSKEKHNCSKESVSALANLVDDAVAPTTTSEPATEAKEPDTFSAKFDDCLNELKEAVGKCDAATVQALDKCKSESAEKNVNIDEASIIATSVSGLLEQQRIQKTSTAIGKTDIQKAESCQTANLATVGGLQFLKLFKETCEEEQKNCQKSCGSLLEKLEKSKSDYLAQCRQDLEAKGVTPNQFNEDKENGKTHTMVFNEKYESLVKAVKKETVACNDEIEVEQGDVEAFANEINDATNRAQFCQCALATGGSPDCDLITNAAACIQNPALPNCSYTIKPGAPGPPITGPGQNGKPSAFAVGNQPNYVPPADILPAGGGLSTTGLDFGDDTPAGVAAKAADQSTGGSPFGSAPGGGAGGGGGGGGGRGGGSGDEAAAEEEGGSPSILGGLFNKAKSGLASLLGAGKPNSNAGKPAYKDKKEVDKNKPTIRGLAGGVVAGRAGTIWERVTKKYNDHYQTFDTSADAVSIKGPK